MSRISRNTPLYRYGLGLTFVILVLYALGAATANGATPEEDADITQLAAVCAAANRFVSEAGHIDTSQYEWWYLFLENWTDNNASDHIEPVYMQLASRGEENLDMTQLMVLLAQCNLAKEELVGGNNGE